MTQQTLFYRAGTVLCAAFTLAGCSTMTANPSPPNLDGSAWVLASLVGQPSLADAPPTLRFADGRMQGSDGCNRYSAPFAVVDGRLQVGPSGAATRMACAEPIARQAEAFQRALRQATGYRVDGQSLSLFDAVGRLTARFSAQDTGLVGTAWQVQFYNNGQQAVISLAAGTQMTLAFLPDGRLSGWGGCNRYSGSYIVDGSRFGIGPLVATRMACANPEGVMAQESAFLRALESVASLSREGRLLELRSTSGALAASLKLTISQAP